MAEPSPPSTDHPTELTPSPGDIVVLEDPYSGPANHGGVYTHGIVAEIVSRVRGPDSSPRTVAVIPFNPVTKSLYLRHSSVGSRGVPEYVDTHVDALTVIEQGHGRYKNEDPDAAAYRDEHGSYEGFLQQFPADPHVRWQQLEPVVEAAVEAGALKQSPRFLGDELDGPTIVLTAVHGRPEGDLVVDAATRAGFEITTRQEHADATTYYLADPAAAEAFGV